MAFIIRKTSRGGTTPYAGPTCARAGVEPGRIYGDRGTAERDAKTLTDYNAVGFEVVELDVDECDGWRI